MPRKPKTTGNHYSDPFPERLRELMRDRNLKQDDLVPVLGVSKRQSVTGYMDGSTAPTAEKLIALADFFGVSTDYLLKRTEEPNPVTELRAVYEYTKLSAATIERLHKLDDKSGIVRVLFEEMVDPSSSDVSPIESAILSLIASAKAQNDYFEGMDKLRAYRKEHGYNPDDEHVTKPVYDEKIGAYVMDPLSISSDYLKEAEDVLTGKLSTLLESIRDKIALQIKGKSEEDAEAFYLPPWSEDEEICYEI